MKAWAVDVTGVFEEWFDGLSESEREDVIATVDLLKAVGPQLGYPHTSKIRGSRHGRMRELRIQHEGRPYRVLYAFDPRRTGILLCGGDKTGNKRWYEEMVPLADRLFDQHLGELRQKERC